MKVVTLSALRTGEFYLQEINLALISVGAWGGVVVKALLVGQSRVQFLVVSLDFSVTYFILTAPWPWGQLSP